MANRRRKSGGRDILLSRERERERERGKRLIRFFLSYVTCRAVDDARSFELQREFVPRLVIVGSGMET